MNIANGFIFTRYAQFSKNVKIIDYIDYYG